MTQIQQAIQKQGMTIDQAINAIGQPHQILSNLGMTGQQYSQHWNQNGYQSPPANGNGYQYPSGQYPVQGQFYYSPAPSIPPMRVT